MSLIFPVGSGHLQIKHDFGYEGLGFRGRICRLRVQSSKVQDSGFVLRLRVLCCCFGEIRFAVLAQVAAPQLSTSMPNRKIEM